MPSFSTYIDGNWIDMGSLAVGIGYAIIRHRRQPTGFSKRFFSKETGIDIVNGMGLFPLSILSLSALSSWTTQQLIGTSRITLSVAAVVALFAILDE